MLSVSRFTRLVIVAVLLVTVPAAFFFYPSVTTGHDLVTGDRMDQGGIDSEHWRDPVPPEELMDDEALQLSKDANKAEAAQAVADADIHRPPPDDPVDIQAANAKHGDEPGSGHVDGHGHAHAAGDDHGTNHAVEGQDKPPAGFATVAQDVLAGSVIMPHLNNATAKAELGRAAWRVLHLMTLRYPDDDRTALKSFFYLFSRLYPCGDCAEHFQALLKDYPPQTSSRKSASLWLCSVHNLVNERLGKPQFDCLTLDATYDCGCGNSTDTASAGPTNTAKLV